MIFVTGGSGFIGSYVIQRLGENSDVIAVENKTTIKGNVRKLKANLLDLNSCPNQEITTVIHLAAQIKEDNYFESFETMEKVNIYGLYELLKYSKRNRVKRFIHLSSMMVYKTPENGEFITEDTPLIPSTFYGITKLTAELLVRKYCLENNIEYIILRPSHVYGFGQNENYLIEKWVRNTISKGTIEVINEGTSVMNTIYIKDLVSVIYHCLYSSEYNFVTNVVSRSNVKYIDLAYTISDIFGNNDVEIIHTTNENFKSKTYIYKYPKLLEDWNIDISNIEEGLIQYKSDLINMGVI